MVIDFQSAFLFVIKRSSMSPSIVGFIGFGEAASCLVQHLSSQGVKEILVYCSGNTNRPPYAPKFRSAVEASGAVLVESIEDLTKKSDVIFSAVVVSSAVETGLLIASHLKRGTLVIDINASTPKAKKQVSLAIENSGGSFVDANLMGAVSIYGAKVPLYCSGGGVSRFEKAFSPLGLSIEDAGIIAGASAAVKMLRSVVTKGMEALIVEAMTAASLAGVRKEALRNICDPMDATKFSNFADMCLRTDVLHAERRAIEMDGAVETISDLGITPLMAIATAARLRASAALGLRDKFSLMGKYQADEVLDAYVQKIESSS